MNGAPTIIVPIARAMALHIISGKSRALLISGVNRLVPEANMLEIGPLKALCSKEFG